MIDGFYVGLTASQKAVAAKCTPLEREFAMQWLKRGCDPSQAIDAVTAALGDALKTRPLSRSALKQRAARMQVKQSVNDFIDVVRQHSIHSAIMEKEEAQLRLSHKARCSMDDVLDWSEYIAGYDDEGEPIYQTAWRIKNISDLPPHVKASIKSVSIDAGGRLKIDLYDSTASLKLLSEMKGWKAPTQHELTGKDQSPLGLGIDPATIDEATLAALLAESTQKILDAL